MDIFLNKAAGFVNGTAQQPGIELQPFFTQRETCFVTTFFIFLPRRNSFLSSNSLCKLLTRMAGIWRRRERRLQVPVARAPLPSRGVGSARGRTALPPRSWGCSGFRGLAASPPSHPRLRSRRVGHLGTSSFWLFYHFF